jgi:hypothetical protein
MNANTQQSKWYIDLALFTAFIAAFFVDLTGLALHQWLGIGVLAISIYHLITHWKWVKSVTRQFFSQAARRPKLYYLIDAAIMLGMLAIIGTGIVISSWLNLTTITFTAWKTIHVAASATTLVLTVAKIGLHWRWIVTAARKAPTLTAPKPAVAAHSYTRRQFVGLMGLVSIASIACLSNAVKSLPFGESAAADDSSNTVSGSTPDTSAVSSTTNSAVTAPSDASPIVSDVSAQAQPSSVCIINCNRNCPFPGRCHRYVDTNGNNRCDNSECAG